MNKTGRAMKMNTWVLPLVIMAVWLQSCGNSDYQRNNDGLVYRIISNGKGEKIKPKTYLKLHQRVVIGDSVLFTSFSGIPSYGFLDSMQVAAHDFIDILDEMRVGDSAIVVRFVDTLFNRGQLQYNNFLKKGGTIKIYVKVLESFKDEAAMNADREKSMQAFKLREISELEKYVAGLKLKNVEKTPEGIYVAIEKQGTGARADSGMYVKVKYTGRLKDGTVFDSNTDSAFGHMEPFGFPVGQRQVIEGWDIGIKKLNAGSKAKLFIPSMMGYGPNGSGAKIPPFATLIFDIEVLEVLAEKPVVPNMDQPVQDSLDAGRRGAPEKGHEGHGHE